MGLLTKVPLILDRVRTHHRVQRVWWGLAPKYVGSSCGRCQFGPRFPSVNVWVATENVPSSGSQRLRSPLTSWEGGRTHGPMSLSNGADGEVLFEVHIRNQEEARGVEKIVSISTFLEPHITYCTWFVWIEMMPGSQDTHVGVWRRHLAENSLLSKLND